MTYIVLPAYNAAATIKATLDSVPNRERYKFLVCDDASQDKTVEVCRELGLEVIVHVQNRGYGANQKTLYNEVLGRMRNSALGCCFSRSFASLRDAHSVLAPIPPSAEPCIGAVEVAAKQHPSTTAHKNEEKNDVVVMLHPDNQYDGGVIPKMVELIQSDQADFVLGNRMSGQMPTQAGMPLYKQFSNRALTNLQSRVYGVRLGEFHTGLRAYRREVLETINYNQFSDDFVFDSEVIAAVIAHGFRVAEVPVQARYFKEASSINFRRSVKYGLETLKVLWKFKKGYYK